MNIIAVDDEPHALRSVERAIKGLYPDAGPALYDTADEALKYAAGQRVDIALLDIEMSGMNGLALAKQLKEINSKTNIVFVTGYSEYALDAYSVHPTGYLLKPVTEDALRSVMENLRYPVAPKPAMSLRVQTFGNFEVFSGGKPVHFPRSKSKEVFAYLVHKNGASCTIRELAAALEENTAENIRTYISVMMRALEEAGHGDVVHKTYNSIAVDTAKFDCDLYRFLKMDPEAVNSYAGEYMVQYSWAEFTSGYLDRKM